MADFDEAGIAGLERIVDRLGLPDADRRLLAGHDEPDAGRVLDGLGRLLLLNTEPHLIPLYFGAAVAQVAPDRVRELIGAAVDETAEELIEELTEGLSFPELEGGEAERQ